MTRKYEKGGGGGGWKREGVRGKKGGGVSRRRREWMSVSREGNRRVERSHKIIFYDYFHLVAFIKSQNISILSVFKDCELKDGLDS